MRFVLDTGALIAFDRGDERVRAELAIARRHEVEVVTTAPVLGQAWRDGKRQVMLGRLIASIRIDAPDEVAAKQAGVLLARAKSSDVVDALLVGLIRDDDTVLTSDPDDVEHLLEARGIRAKISVV